MANLKDDNTPDHLVSRKCYVEEFFKSLFVTKFNSRVSNSVSKCIFDVKHLFMTNIDDFNSFSTKAEEFIVFVEDGMNKKDFLHFNLVI